MAIVSEEPKTIGGDQAGDDHGPAEPKEIWGWYMYDFANSPYYQVYLGTVVSILLKWMAEEHAWSGYVADHGGDEAAIPLPWPDKENLSIPGFGVSAGSYPLVINAVTTFAELICFLTFSPLGDYGSRRKQLLILFTCCGAGVTMLNVVLVDSSLWWLAGLLRVASGVFFGLCLVLYNAYLPHLAAAHPAVRAVEGDERAEKESDVLDELSGKGMSVGFVGGALLTAVCFVLSLMFECENADGAGCTEFERFFWPGLFGLLVGVWWLTFSQFSFWTLKPRPGPAFPVGENFLCLGWKQTGHTLRMIVNYRHLLLFIISYFIYSDSYNTMLSVAPLILESETEAKLSTVFMYGLILLLVMIVGIFVTAKLQGWFNVSTKKMILGELLLYAAVSVAGGARIISTLGNPGLYIVYIPTVLFYGSIQSYSRSLFAELVPNGKESAMFAFYEITDKGSNFVGTAATALIHNETGGYEAAFLYTLPALLVAALLMYYVDVENGREEAGKRKHGGGGSAAAEEEAKPPPQQASC